MRGLLRSALWLAGLGVVLLLIGLVLPAEQRVQRTRTVNLPAEKIWPHLVAPKQWAAWQPWIRRDPAMAITYDGPASGVGARWSWTSTKEGSGSMRLTVAERPRFLGYALRFDAMGTTAQGEFRLSAVPQGTEVTWAMLSDMGRNPVSRWFGLFLDRMVGPDFELGLANLEAAASR
jgi:uncharacterized protein YndB with AHSA1/START domain